MHQLNWFKTNMNDTKQFALTSIAMKKIEKKKFEYQRRGMDEE